MRAKSGRGWGGGSGGAHPTGNGAAGSGWRRGMAGARRGRPCLSAAALGPLARRGAGRGARRSPARPAAPLISAGLNANQLRGGRGLLGAAARPHRPVGVRGCGTRRSSGVRDGTGRPRTAPRSNGARWGAGRGGCRDGARAGRCRRGGCERRSRRFDIPPARHAPRGLNGTGSSPAQRKPEPPSPPVPSGPNPGRGGGQQPCAGMPALPRCYGAGAGPAAAPHGVGCLGGGEPNPEDPRGARGRRWVWVGIWDRWPQPPLSVTPGWARPGVAAVPVPVGTDRSHPPPHLCWGRKAEVTGFGSVCCLKGTAEPLVRQYGGL